MRYHLLHASLYALALFSLAGCYPHHPTEGMTWAFTIIGPQALQADDSTEYTVVMGVGGKAADYDYVDGSLFYLQEIDGTLLAKFSGIHMPPGVDSQVWKTNLACIDGKLTGTFLGFSDHPNNPVSSGGSTRAAKVAVDWIDNRYDGSRDVFGHGYMGNEVSIGCVPPIPTHH